MVRWLVVALASVGALHLSAAMNSVLGAALAFYVAWFAINVSVSLLLDAWEKRGVRRWITRPSMVLGALALLIVTGGAGSAIVIGPSRMQVPPTSGLLLVALTTFVAVILKSVADLLAWATRSSPLLRRRLYVVTAICAALASVVAFFLAVRMAPTAADGELGVALLAALGLSAPIVWLLLHPLVRQVTEGIERAVAALRRFAAGDLHVALEVQGRDEIAALSRAFNDMVGVTREKAFLEDAFGRYVTPGVLDALRRSGGLRIVPARITCSVLFADIRGFTAFSERHSPEEVMTALNDYLSRVTAIVERHDGYINKFIGDAVMVVFGAPVPQDDHAPRAVRCGADMQRALLELNRERQIDDVFAIGIGVNTGEVVAGTLGGENRAEYTVIGDSVNVASRLTSAARAGELVVSEATASAARDVLDFSAPEPLAVKGKAEPLTIRRWASSLSDG